jgi:hypothetical protein
LLLLFFFRGFFHNAQASDAGVALLVPCQCCRCDTQQALGFSGTDSKLLVRFKKKNWFQVCFRFFLVLASFSVLSGLLAESLMAHCRIATGCKIKPASKFVFSHLIARG